jgi:hypothetical protein
MANNDNDLFDRLRQVGLRKKVAKTLSAVSDGANKKAANAARSAITELRSLADELERRLPGTGSKTKSATSRRKVSSGTTARRASASGTASSGTSASRAPSRSRRGAASSAGAASSTGAASSSGAGSSSGAASSATRSSNGGSTARAPRGQNKAKILASLKSGPKTASEVAKETGIGTGTVGTTLSKLAVSGEVVKAVRGYGLPS